MKVAVAGARGRLGSRICALHDTAVRLVRADPQAGETTDRAMLQGCDVLIDVTAPAQCGELVPWVARWRIPYVVGSTGLSAPQLAALAAAEQDTPVLVAANFSLGVNVLQALVRQANAALPGFDAEIFELHHRHKRDAPSGTALALAAALPGRDHVLERSGVHPRSAGELGFAVARGGDVVGEHTVFLLGDGERIELTHRATHRDIFARGALAAARWLVGRPAGRYSMADVVRVSPPGPSFDPRP
jgi:4-hydroxy-tetrahydrodipicolinate reductase